MAFKEIDDASFLIKQLLVNQDAERASAEKTGEAIYFFLREKKCGFAKIPGWWANDEYGVWMEKIFFHTDKQTDDAIRITECSGTNTIASVIKWYDYSNEETLEMSNHKYKRASKWSHTEPAWLPKSLIEYGAHTGSMVRDDRMLIQYDESQDATEVSRGSIDDAHLFFRDPHKFFWTDDGNRHHKEKIYVDVDYEDREAIKKLDWDEYHPSYDGDEGAWEVDAATGREVVRKLIKEGYIVCLDDEIEHWRGWDNR